MRKLDRLKEWIARAHELGVVAVDTETTSLDPMQAELVGISLALAPNEACYVPLAHRQGGDGQSTGLFAGDRAPDQIAEKAALAALKPMLEDASVLKIGQNLKYDWLIFAQRGIDIAPHDDTMLMSYVLDAGKNGHGMDELSEKWLGHTTIHFKDVAKSGKTLITFDNVAIDKATEYAAEDADVTLRLWQALKPRLVAEHVTTVYETLERPLVPVLASMERRGISIDRQVLSRLSGEFAQKAAGLEHEIQKLAGEPINPGSPKQLGDILFGKMKLPGGTKTKTGQWSTGARELEELAEQGHELPQKILDWRQVSKLKSTYTDALPTFVNPQTKRVHTSYALAATTTGRLSSSEPNLQNIPVRTEEGRKIRRAFIADDGCKLVSADYSQVELRLLAEIADIAALKKAFRDGLDIHAMTASEMFGVPIKGMPGEVRRRAKAINFGIIYGISAFGLASSARHPARGSRRLHQEIFRALPRHPRLHRGDQGVLQEARLCGHAVRPQMPLSRHRQFQSLDPRLQRARRHQRAPARLRRRHHPPRHGAHRAGAQESQALRADAAAGARRTDLRSARERSRENLAGGEEGDGRRAHAGGVALGAARRSTPAPRTIGTRRIRASSCRLRLALDPAPSRYPNSRICAVERFGYLPLPIAFIRIALK